MLIFWPGLQHLYVHIYDALLLATRKFRNSQFCMAIKFSFIACNQILSKTISVLLWRHSFTWHNWIEIILLAPNENHEIEIEIEFVNIIRQLPIDNPINAEKLYKYWQSHWLDYDATLMQQIVDNINQVVSQEGKGVWSEVI